MPVCLNESVEKLILIGWQFVKFLHFSCYWRWFICNWSEFGKEGSAMGCSCVS